MENSIDRLPVDIGYRIDFSVLVFLDSTIARINKIIPANINNIIGT